MTFIWRDNTNGYLQADTICFEERTRAMLEENCELRETDNIRG